MRCRPISGDKLKIGTKTEDFKKLTWCRVTKIRNVTSNMSTTRMPGLAYVDDIAVKPYKKAELSERRPRDAPNAPENFESPQS